MPTKLPQSPSGDSMKVVYKVIRVGWFGFEGFGRPFEGWHDFDGKGQEWFCCGRAFTWSGARRKARRHRERWAAKHRPHERAMGGVGGTTKQQEAP